MKIKATLILLFSFSVTLLFSQPYLMNGDDNLIQTCGSFLLDDGGGTQGYSPNQNITLTICSDGSEGTHIQLIFSGTEIAPGDDLCFFDGTNPSAPSLGCASDFNGGSAFIIQATAANLSGCVTLVFSSNASGEGAGWSADINCVPSCQLIEAVLVSSTPDADPIDNGYIDICPGDNVQFFGTANYPQNGIVYQQSNLISDFEWDFGDGTIAEGENVSHVYDEPGGYIVQLTVTDQFGCRSTNFLSQRVRVATSPQFNLGGDLPTEICVNDTIHLNSQVNVVDDEYVVSTIPTEGSFQAGATRSDSLALPDGDGVSYETTVAFTDFAPGQILEDINDLEAICVNMEHSWMRDLEIKLTCPNGQFVTLHNHPGQDGGEVWLGTPIDNDGFNPTPGTGGDYCWTPDATAGTWIEWANANDNPWTFDPLLMPEGDYNSFQPLSNLEGCPLNGEWKITVTDLWPIDNGFIFSWSLNFDNELYPDLEKFTPTLVDWNWALAPHTFFQTPDSISSVPINAGNIGYEFMVIDEFGCEHDTMVNLTVLPPTHPDCYNCEDLLVPSPDTMVCVGEPIDIDMGTAYEEETIVQFESFANTKFNATSNPPASPLSANIDVNSIYPSTIQNPFDDIQSVCVDITSETAGNLRIYLHSPNGYVMTLSTNNGGQGNDYTQTCFTPDASTNVTLGSAPFTGNWQPESSWNQMNGATINGEWRLEVSDISNTTTQNTLNWWSIEFKSQNDVNYQWSPSSNLSCNNCPDPTLTPSQTTTLFVQASDVHDCLDEEVMQIDVFQGYAAPELSFEMITGGIIEFTWEEVGQGLSYEVNINNTGWISPNNGNTSHLISGLMNGSEVDFQVRVAIANVACDSEIDQEFVTFLMCDQFNAFINIPPPYSVDCPGVCDASVPVSAQNGVAPFVYTATDDSGNTFSQNNGNFTGLCPGSYTIVVEDATGCMDSVQFTVEEPQPVTLNAFQLQPVSCFEGSDGQATVQAFGGTEPYNYEWSDQVSQITQTAVGLPANDYMVTVTDDNGCIVSTDVTITEPDELLASATGSNILCFGEATGSGFVTVTGGNPGQMFDWGGFGNNPTGSFNDGLPAGTYEVTVTDAKNCMTTTNLTLTQPSSPVDLVVQQTLLGCDGVPNSEAMVTPSGGTPGYSYNWSNGDNSNMAFDLATQNYTVTVTDGNGCTVVGDIDIEDLEPYELNIQFTEPNCNGSSDGQMSVIVISGGAAPDPDCTGCGFEWSNGGSTQFINGLQGGQNYGVTITDQQGCVGSISKFLPQPEPIGFDLIPEDASCFGSTDGQATVNNVTNANGNVTYQWDANAQNQTTETAGNLAAGTYSVVLTDMNACTATQSIEIGQPDQILVDFTVIDNECNGDAEGAVDAAASGGNPGFSFEWSTGATTSKVSGLASGDYLVTITDAIGCTTEETVFVGEPDPINAEIVGTDVTCFGDRDGTLTITPQGGTPPFLYSTDGEIYFGSSTLIGLEVGNYPVYIQDGNGCISQQEGMVNGPDEFIIAGSYKGEEITELTLSLGDSARIWIVNQGSDKFFGNSDATIWDPAYMGSVRCSDGSYTDSLIIGCNSIIVKPNDPIFINVFAFDDNGCEAEMMLNIKVNKDRTVLVPTGFTPNNDGANDLLQVHGKAGTAVTSFRVFDRWGEMVYEGIDFMVNDNVGWNGKFKNEDMPAGVYIWHLNVKFVDGREEMLTGQTTLIR